MTTTNTAALTQEQAMALIAKLTAERDALKAASNKRLSMKVTTQRKDEKTGKMVGVDGAMSVYGLGRFPVTLYAGQWERLLDASVTIRQFLQDNVHLLATKG